MKSGYIQNVGALTPKAILLRERLLGPSIPRLKGSKKRKKNKLIDPSNSLTDVGSINIPNIVTHPVKSLSIDLFFIDGVTCLIAVANPIRYIVTTTCGRTKATDPLGHAMDIVLSKFQKHGCPISHLITDREGGILALEPKMAKYGITIHTCDGASVGEAERAIQHVREQTRTALSTLPAPIVPTKMKLGIMLGVTSLINVMNGSHLALTGHVVNYKLHMKAKIGDFCHGVPAGETSNSVDIERTRGFILTSFTFNLVGSVVGLNLMTYMFARYLPANFTPFPCWHDAVLERVATWAKMDSPPTAVGKDIMVKRAHDDTVVPELTVTDSTESQVPPDMPTHRPSNNEPDPVDLVGSPLEQSTSTRTRHIAIRFFWIKDLQDRKEISVKHLSTHEMIADFLTKPLQGLHFLRLRDLILGSVQITDM
jgi:hypothetical protein